MSRYEKPVEIQTAFGDWMPAIALTGPRHDVQNAIDRRNVWSSILVEVEGWDHPINWPAEHVRPLVPSETQDTHQ